MSQDLQQYSEIIDKLKPFAQQPEFDQVLQQLSNNIPREKRFLIKMEVKRLARQCLRSIDLRDYCEEECELYEYEGIRHYLDASALDTFSQQIKIYGNYCFGVYEAVILHNQNQRIARANQLNDTPKEKINEGESSRDYRVPLVNLLRYNQRDEERMNFAVAIEVFKQDNTSSLATSIDISSSGMKFKLTGDFSVVPNETIHVYFRGLESEYTLDKLSSIAYTVLEVIPKDSKNYVSLKRKADEPNDTFDRFLENFINGNKRRYKVNLNNTIDAIINKTCEQYFSASYPSLPIFINWQDNVATPKFAMANEVNKDIISYWSDENEVNKLGYLVNESRLRDLVKQHKRGETPCLYVFAFNQVQNEHIYFYSATHHELAEYESIKNLYLGFASRKVSWRVFKITLDSIDPEDAHAPLSLPDSLGINIKRQNTPPAPRLMSQLKYLTYVAQITDITSEQGRQAYAKNPLEKKQINKLQAFAHPRNVLPPTVKAFKYRFIDQRIETRYLLRSPVTLNVGRHTYQGISEDISVKGVRVELSEPYSGEVLTDAVVSFPKLQNITKKYNVMSLNYHLIDISEDRLVLHLKAVEGSAGTTARSFFDELIKKNRNLLDTYPDEEDIPGIGHAMRCINARNTPCLSFLLSRENGKYRPQAAALSPNELKIQKMLLTAGLENQLNLEPFFRDRNQDTPHIQQNIKQMKVEHHPLHHELYIAFNPIKDDPKLNVIPRYSSSFKSHEQLKKFMIDALTHGQFIALSVDMSSTSKPDLDMLQAEINYLGIYALHRARALEEKLWDISACLHATDITEEVMRRYKMPEQTILLNQNKFV